MPSISEECTTAVKFVADLKKGIAFDDASTEVRRLAKGYQTIDDNIQRGRSLFDNSNLWVKKLEDYLPNAQGAEKTRVQTQLDGLKRFLTEIHSIVPSYVKLTSIALGILATGWLMFDNSKEAAQKAG